MIAGFEDLVRRGNPSLRQTGVGQIQESVCAARGEGLGMVFQAFAVWPHMNIFDKRGISLKIQVNKTDIAKWVKEALHHCSLDGLEEVYPSDLSGGQQQRISSGQPLSPTPRSCFWMSPFPIWIPSLGSPCFEIKELQRKFNFTIIFVTHDQSEAKWPSPTG